MFSYNVNPRDGYRTGMTCDVCCCETVLVRPGEINKFLLNYAPWSVPIGGKGLSVNTQFEVTYMTPDVVVGGNQPVSVLPQSVDTPAATVLNSALAPFASDPEAATLKFKVLPFYGPQHGELVLAEDGTYQYTPNPTYNGFDFFYWTVSDGFNKPTVGYTAIRVGANVPAALAEQPAIVRVPGGRAKVNTDYHTLEFPVEISPAAKIGDIYRLQVRQQAYDCDCNAYYHVACFDLKIGSC